MAQMDNRKTVISAWVGLALTVLTISSSAMYKVGVFGKDVGKYGEKIDQVQYEVQKNASTLEDHIEADRLRNEEILRALGRIEGKLDGK